MPQLSPIMWMVFPFILFLLLGLVMLILGETFSVNNFSEFCKYVMMKKMKW